MTQVVTLSAVEPSQFVLSGTTGTRVWISNASTGPVWYTSSTSTSTVIIPRYTSTSVTTTMPYHSSVSGGLVTISCGGVLYTSSMYSTVGGSVSPFNVVRESKSLLRKRNRLTRSAVKRALALMSGLGMDNEVRIFLGNEAFEVQHSSSRFKFVISRNSKSVLALTDSPGYSTPYKLELRTAEDEHVANLCVIVEDTPMLDQILAVSMFVKSGAEDVILEEANFLNKTTDMELLESLAQDYPNLKHKLLPRNHSLLLH